MENRLTEAGERDRGPGGGQRVATVDPGQEGLWRSVSLQAQRGVRNGGVDARGRFPEGRT